jgi:hypothetical protein
LDQYYNEIIFEGEYITSISDESFNLNGSAYELKILIEMDSELSCIFTKSISDDYEKKKEV